MKCFATCTYKPSLLFSHWPTLWCAMAILLLFLKTDLGKGGIQRQWICLSAHSGSFGVLTFNAVVFTHSPPYVLYVRHNET